LAQDWINVGILAVHFAFGLLASGTVCAAWWRSFTGFVNQS
jgi:hypothetical protein